MTKSRTEQPNGKIFVIYSRKSRFTGKGESIENQIELCRRHIASNYGVDNAEKALVYEDEGFSGGTLERPQFKKMMQDSKRIRIAAIVVYRLDRISRNIGDFAKLIEELKKNGIDFISIREQFDTSSPMGRAMMYIASVFSQLERETIAERIRDNMHELAKTGRWLGGVTPTGYESESLSDITVDGKVKRSCKLKAIPSEIQTVRTIFEKFSETSSLLKVGEFLSENGFKTKQGKQFSRFAIKAILSNPVYMTADSDAYKYFTQCGFELFSDKSEFNGSHGVMVYNRTHQTHGKAHQMNAPKEWIVSVGKHIGAVSGNEWVDVQRKLEQNRSPTYRKPRTETALLSGILICGSCLSRMRPKRSQRTTADGDPVYTYICTPKEKSRGTLCSQKNANGNSLDSKIIEKINCMLNYGSDYARQVLQIKKSVVSKHELHDSQIAKAKEQIKENKETIRSLVMSLAKASGSSAEDYIIKQIDELNEKQRTLKKQANIEEFSESQDGFDDSDFLQLCQNLSSFDCIIKKMSLEQRRDAIRSVVEKIVWKGEDADIYFVGSNGMPLCEYSE